MTTMFFSNNGNGHKQPPIYKAEKVIIEGDAAAIAKQDESLFRQAAQNSLQNYNFERDQEILRAFNNQQNQRIEMEKLRFHPKNSGPKSS